MNIYEKLIDARMKLQQADIKKSGHNKNLNFYYMELDDFLPKVNEINKELGIFTMFSINESTATCKVINAEKPEEFIEFTSHTAHAKLNGAAAPIQELGSQHTYLRRYLYLMVYEISEHDSLDAQIESEQPQQNKKQQTTVSEKQVNRLLAIAKSKGYNKESVIKASKKHYQIEDLSSLNKTQYDELCAGYEKLDNSVEPDTGDLFNGYVPGA